MSFEFMSQMNESIIESPDQCQQCMRLMKENEILKRDLNTLLTLLKGIDINTKNAINILAPKLASHINDNTECDAINLPLIPINDVNFRRAPNAMISNLITNSVSKHIENDSDTNCNERHEQSPQNITYFISPNECPAIEESQPKSVLCLGQKSCKTRKKRKLTPIHNLNQYLGVVRYHCDWIGCHTFYETLSDLNNHRRTHIQSAKKFKCEWSQCTYSSNSSNSLKVHQRSHTGEKPFPCDWPQCTYKGLTMFHLKIHKRSHTGEKGYKCDFPQCTYETAYSNSLSRHKRSVHWNAH